MTAIETHRNSDFRTPRDIRALLVRCPIVWIEGFHFTVLIYKPNYYPKPHLLDVNQWLTVKITNQFNIFNILTIKNGPDFFLKKQDHYHKKSTRFLILSILNLQ